MFMPKPLHAFALAVTLGSGAAVAEGPNLGRPIDPADIAPWDISILPDGTGLPPGGGTPAQGECIFAHKCAMCHGERGKGGVAAAVVGGGPIDRIEPTKTIANVWGSSTTVFDFIQRAISWQQPRSLSDNVVYVLTAHILSENRLIVV